MVAKTYLSAREVARLTGTGEKAARVLINEMNTEMEEKGFRSVRYRVNLRYFADRMMLTTEQIAAVLDSPPPPKHTRKKKEPIAAAPSSQDESSNPAA